MTQALLRALARVVGLMPRAVMTLLGRALGTAAFRLAAGRRQVVFDNLKLAYGGSLSGAEAAKIARDVFINVATLLFEFTRTPWFDKSNVARFVSMEGAEHLDEALSKGRGVILLTGHFASWELIAPCAALNGYPLEIVARDLDNPVVNEFVKWIRSRGGNRVLPKSKTMLTLFKRLKKNGITVLLVDQNVTWEEGFFVDFFGTKVCSNKGPAQLALASGAAVVPAFMTRRGAGNVFVIGREIELIRTGDDHKDAVLNTALFTRIIEDEVRKRPGEWFWLHRRWKTRPRGPTDLLNGLPDKTTV